MIDQLQQEKSNLAIKSMEHRSQMNLMRQKIDSKRRSNCNHYAINASRFTKPSEIHEVVRKTLEKDKFWIKRIIKPNTR